MIAFRRGRNQVVRRLLRVHLELDEDVRVAIDKLLYDQLRPVIPIPYIVLLMHGLENLSFHGSVLSTNTIG